MRSLEFLVRPFIDYVIRTKGYPKFRYHLVYPLLIALIVGYFSTPDLDNLINSVFTALSFISGFSFAALIAFPNIQSDFLNENVLGNKILSSEVCKITFPSNNKGHTEQVSLKRKSFISLLLGYICFTSTILLLICIILKNIPIINIYLKYILFCVFLWLFSALLINVLYSIQYFTKINFDENTNN